VLQALWGLPAVAAVWLGGRLLAPLVVAAPNPDRPARLLLGTLDELERKLEASRAGALVLAEAKLVLVPRSAAGESKDELPFVAHSLLCTHLGCTLRLSADGARLDCPCHGSRFGLSAGPAGGVGRVLRGPAALPLPRRRLVRVGERVYVETS